MNVIKEVGEQTQRRGEEGTGGEKEVGRWLGKGQV